MEPRLRRAQQQIALAAPKAVEEAVADLQSCLHDAERMRNVGQISEVRALLALGLHTQGRTETALVTLKQAVEAASTLGAVRTFVDFGQPMVELLGRLAGKLAPRRDALIAQHIKHVVDAFAIRPAVALPNQRELNPVSAEMVRNQTLLTEREHEILALLAAHLSNEDIAERLVLSVFTVKTHARNIYGKLKVANRRQAVAKAVMLGILPWPAAYTSNLLPLE
jgi:LuxR family maltose regulon positive regulatory protein